MAWRKLPMMGAAVVLWVSCLPDGAPPPPSQTTGRHCASSADCAGDEHCARTTCGDPSCVEYVCVRGGAEGDACQGDSDCDKDIFVGNLGCPSGGACLDGRCEPACQHDSDCRSGVCVKYAGTADCGTCATSGHCDPLSGSGCAAGQDCQLVPTKEGSVATTCDGNAPSGAGAPAPTLEVLTLFTAYGTSPSNGDYGADSYPLCRLDHPSCASGTTCLPLDAPLGPIDGVEYGACRTLCDPWDPAACDPTREIFCMIDTQPGKAPVSLCAPFASACDDVGCTHWGPAGASCDIAAVATETRPVNTWCANGCATSSDCPSWEKCLGGSCVAGWPCNPLGHGADCGAPSQRCAVASDGSGGGTPSCRAAGSIGWPGRCAADADCVAGQACTHYGDPSAGVCEPYCNTVPAAIGDASGSCNSGECVAVSPAVAVPVPSLAPPFQTIGLGTCRVPCDPVDPAKSCPATFTCVAYVDSGGATHSDCVEPTGSGTGPGACATSPLQCAPGMACQSGSCVKWCYVGVQSTCNARMNCVPLQPAVVLGGTHYGTCQ